MNRVYKKLSIVFIMVFAIMLGCFTNVLAANDDAEIGTANLNNTIDNSAKFGDQLVQPEKGWKRYDDASNLVEKIGSGWKHNESYYMCYKSYAYCSSITTDQIVIRFKGTKIRLINLISGSYGFTPVSNVYIDNVLKGSFDTNKLGKSQFADQKGSVLVFEQLGLDDTIHELKLTNGSTGILNLDAVDIDANGQLMDPSTVLNMEPEKNKIHLNETVSANLTIDNIKDIAAEDVRIKYDSSKLQFLGAEEVDGIKLVKQPDSQPGELRFIVASKGEKNIINAKKALLKLKFKGIAKGEALVNITKGRVSDGIEMEKDLTDEQCGKATIIIDENALKDVNNSGEFTLLDLGIDARHMGKDPKAAELAKYNTDIVQNNAIDEADLLEIGKFMLENPNYKF